MGPITLDDVGQFSVHGRTQGPTGNAAHTATAGHGNTAAAGNADVSLAPPVDTSRDAELAEYEKEGKLLAYNPDDIFG